MKHYFSDTYTTHVRCLSPSPVKQFVINIMTAFYCCTSFVLMLEHIFVLA